MKQLIWFASWLQGLTILCVFTGMALPKFIKQNLVPLVIPLTVDNLELLKEDGRPHVVAVLESGTTPEAKAFIGKMKGAARANRAFVFSHVVASQWPKFVRPFNLGKKPVLPTVLIWEGQTYSKVSPLYRLSPINIMARPFLQGYGN